MRSWVFYPAAMDVKNIEIMGEKRREKSSTCALPKLIEFSVLKAPGNLEFVIFPNSRWILVAFQ